MAALVLALGISGPIAGPAAAAEPCALPDATLIAGTSGGLGGTGRSDEGGIGGTGVREAPRRGGEEGGIGGTGNSGGDEGGIGGTGVLGTVTGFGSLCVNGMRIAYDGGALIVLRGEPGDLDDLAIGQVVWLEAIAGETGWYADRIEIVSAALGPIAEIDRGLQRVRIDGRWVEMRDETILVDEEEPIGFLDLAVGDVLDVAALPTTDRGLIASRIDRHPRLPRGYARLDAISFGLGGLTPGRRVSIEGYAATPVRDRRISLPDLDLRIPETATGARLPDRGARLIVEGAVTQGGVRVERLLARPSRPGRPGINPERPAGKERPADRTPSPTVDRVESPVLPDIPSPPTRDLPDLPAPPPAIERPIRIERPDRPARPERPAVDRPERPERPERPAADVLAPRTSF